MNAKRLIVTLVFVAVLIGFMIWIFDVLVRDASRKNRIWREKAAIVTQAVEDVNSKQKDIMILGNPVDAPQGLRCRHIDDLYEESLACNDETFVHDGHVLIINDPDGEVPMNEERIAQIFELWKYQGYVIVYLGTARLPELQDAGFFFDEYPKSTSSVIFWNYGKNYELGFADDPSVIPEVVREQLEPNRVPLFTTVMKLSVNKEYLQSEQ